MDNPNAPLTAEELAKLEGQCRDAADIVDDRQAMRIREMHEGLIDLLMVDAITVETYDRLNRLLLPPTQNEHE